MNLLTSSLSTSFSVPSSPSWAHGGMETDATISDETDKRIGLNSFVYYFSMTYTSIIATESIVTIWMNLRKAFSGKSFTRRIPSKAPIPITGSIRRFSENVPQVILSQAKIWKGTFCRSEEGRIYTYLYNNFREKVVLKDVADFVGQNPTSLCRYFKKSTDKSIFQVLAEIRIEYACKLLANSDLTITEVAFCSGYNTPTLFFEQFQKIIHLTPAVYRREINGTAK